MIWNRVMNGKPHKRFPWFWYLLALFVILAFAFAPIGSVMLCGAIANAYGCKVDEGSVHPCVIGGHDYGELLYSLGVMGWFMLVTIPGGLVAFVTWLIFPFCIAPPGESAYPPGSLLRFRRLQQHENLCATDFRIACYGVHFAGLRRYGGRSAVTDRPYSKSCS